MKKGGGGGGGSEGGGGRERRVMGGQGGRVHDVSFTVQRDAVVRFRLT